MKKKSILKYAMTIGTIAMLSLSTLDMAQAKRFGGGRSFGKSYSQNYNNRPTNNNGYNNNNSFNQQNNGYQQRQQNNGYNQMQQPQQKRSWMPALGGLAAGLGLGYLFSHAGGGLGGFGGSGFGGIFNILMLAGLAYFAYRLFMRRKNNNINETSYMQPSMANANTYNSNDYNSQTPNNQPNQFNQSYQESNHQAGGSFNNFNNSNNYASNNQIPNFDVEGFVRGAKVCFNRLQAAYDTANLNDIREFTSPEVFAECQMQIQERGMQQNITEVLSLQAVLVDTAMEGSTEMASVRFTGSTKENGVTENINEVWHFSRTLPKGWLLCGIEQA
jgi:predicted lipid-binding transport protein (Tim44 family)